MKTYGIFYLLFMLAVSCGKVDREAANRYYDDFSATIVPYKNGTERILTETQVLLRKQLQDPGNVKLSEEDSVKQRTLLKELELLARATIDNLNRLEDFHGAGLKAAGVEYVTTSVDAVLGAYHAIDVTSRNAHGPIDMTMIDSLTRTFSNDLVESNARFAASQMEFLKEFDLLRD